MEERREETDQTSNGRGRREKMTKESRKRLSQRRRAGVVRNLRTNFLAGVLITAPIGITFYLSWIIIDWIDNRITPIIPVKYNPETYLPFSVPGLGLLIVIVSLICIGALAKGVIGRWWVQTSEILLARMPVIRSVYGAVKQIFETILKQQSNAFRQVVLFEYPRRGCWAIGFLTGRTEGEVQSLTEDEVLNVFLPTTPNPTSGYLLFIPKNELVFLSMSVEEGIKMVVSGGIVTPPDRRPDALKAVAQIASAEGDRQTIPHQPDAGGEEDEPDADGEEKEPASAK